MSTASGRFNGRIAATAMKRSLGASVQAAARSRRMASARPRALRDGVALSGALRHQGGRTPPPSLVAADVTVPQACPCGCSRRSAAVERADRRTRAGRRSSGGSVSGPKVVGQVAVGAAISAAAVRSPVFVHGQHATRAIMSLSAVGLVPVDAAAELLGQRGCG